MIKKNDLEQTLECLNMEILTGLKSKQFERAQNH